MISPLLVALSVATSRAGVVTTCGCWTFTTRAVRPCAASIVLVTAREISTLGTLLVVKHSGRQLQKCVFRSRSFLTNWGCPVQFLPTQVRSSVQGKALRKTQVVTETLTTSA